MSNPDLISTSEIAALAGVEISTVSNWRKRFFGTFPEGVVDEREGKRPKFKRSAVVAWLEANPQVGIPQAEARQSIWKILDYLRGSLDTESSRDLVGALMTFIAYQRRQATDVPFLPPHEIRDLFIGSAPLPTEIRELVKTERGLDVPDRVLVDVYDALRNVNDPAAFLDEILTHKASQGPASAESETPAPLRDFLLALADEKSHGKIYDPAAGLAGLLIEAIRQGKGSSARGVELNQSTAKFARRRIYLAEVPATIERGNSFSLESVKDLKADLVVIDPPLGVITSALLNDDMMRPWLFGEPSRLRLDTAWLQEAVSHLTPDGRAIVVTPLSALQGNDKAAAHIRSEMLRRGSVQAIITLPGRMRSNTAIRLAVWVLGQPDLPDRRQSVLLMDAGATGADLLGPDASIATMFHAWMSDPSTELDPTIAASVLVTDLLAPNASILPNRWLRTAIDDRSSSDWKGRLESAYTSALSARSSVVQLPRLKFRTASEPGSTIKISELTRTGELKIWKSRYLERATDESAETYPILAIANARTGDTSDPEQADQTVQSPATTGLLVQPDDVLVYLDHGAVRARVWRGTGWVLGRFMQIVRVNKGDWDPHYIAAAISNPTNERFATDGSIRVNFDLNDFEIVRLPLAEQQQAAKLLEALDLAVQQLEASVAATQVARTELANALTAGAVTAELC